MKILVVAVAMVAATVMSMTTAMAKGLEQTTPPPCVANLYMCKGDLASPSAACCTVLKEEVKSDRDCLCAVLNDPNFLRSFNATTDQVHHLASACGVSDDLSSCAPSSSPKPSPSTPSNGDGKKENWIGMFGLFSLSLICWSIVIS